jgi:hypothetical protein
LPYLACGIAVPAIVIPVAQTRQVVLYVRGVAIEVRG